MVSRLLVQLAMIVVLTVVVFVVAYQHLHVALPPTAYVFGLLAAFLGGALYLGLGQLIAGLQKNAETVNATTRLVYFVFIMVGLFGEMGVLGEQLKNVVRWSPYGTVKTIVAAALQPSAWNSDTSTALVVTVAYSVVFAVLGIRWFRWNTK